MRTRDLIAGFVSALVLAGCGGSGDVATSASVAQKDVAVDADLSWASCGPVTSSEPDERPGGAFFSHDAPDDADLVPGQPVSAAICLPYMGMHSAGGTELELRGSSLDGLVNALNHSPRYDGEASCSDQGGTSQRAVFRYDDGHLLPVLLSTDSCGWADNGAQVRYELETYLSNLRDELDHATG